MTTGWGTTSEGGETSDVLKVTAQTILANTDSVCVTGIYILSFRVTLSES